MPKIEFMKGVAKNAFEEMPKVSVHIPATTPQSPVDIKFTSISRHIENPKLFLPLLKEEAPISTQLNTNAHILLSRNGKSAADTVQSMAKRRRIDSEIHSSDFDLLKQYESSHINPTVMSSAVLKGDEHVLHPAFYAAMSKADPEDVHKSVNDVFKLFSKDDISHLPSTFKVQDEHVLHPAFYAAMSKADPEDVHKSVNDVFKLFSEDDISHIPKSAKDMVESTEI